MTRIRRDLGQDAVIISQRKIRKPGAMGIFSPKIVEVTVAPEEKSEDKKEEKTQNGELLKALLQNASERVQGNTPQNMNFGNNQGFGNGQNFQNNINQNGQNPMSGFQNQGQN